jgi:hypothetical protein
MMKLKYIYVSIYIGEGKNNYHIGFEYTYIHICIYMYHDQRKFFIIQKSIICIYMSMY